MAQTNATILEKAWLAGTNDFQQRIPEPTQSGIGSTINALKEPMNRAYWNQFIDLLVNRIGFTYVRSQAYTHPLHIFKGTKINYGSTIQEIAPKWIKAHAYMDDEELLLKLNRPEVEAWYHSQNRRDRYDISISDDALRTAFVDEYGLNNLVAAILQTPINSDEYDEYRIMVQLIAEYENKWGFYKHSLSAMPTDEATGKEFLTAARAYAARLQFPSSLYNASDIEDIPVFAKPDELVLFVTPEVDASLDVNTLSSVFQLDKADLKYRKIIIDEFPIPNAVALLTTQDFFVQHDTNYQNTSFYNPQTLATNYYLHHWGIYSVSPFVPAILFTTDDATVTPTITQTVSGLTVTPSDTHIAPGSTVTLDSELTGTVAPDGTSITVAPDSSIYTVSVARQNGATTESVPINSRTYVDEYGRLHTQKTTLLDGDIITIKCVATYVNPSGETTEYTANATVTVDTDNNTETPAAA